MCGILAVLDADRSGAAAKLAPRARMLLDRLSHRGPDGSGTIGWESGWIGHRRLAIVDPAGGAQPFAAGSLVWAANAEVYNHEALRTQLSGLPRSRSDCAVIGPLWAVRGVGAMHDMEGQFAFVAADRATGAWIAARDHIGICPLYMGRHPSGTVWFASEMKALVDDCEHVELVPPGHAWHHDGISMRRIKWYRPRWERRVPNKFAELKVIRETLIRAVKRRLMADVPWGVLLSGGVDSSIIAAIVVRLAREAGFGPVHTFALGLEGAPDLGPARRVAEFLGTEHHEFSCTVEEALHALPAVVMHLESYQQIRTAVPTYLLARRVKEQGFKMVLSGEGSDEMLGGYLYFHKAPTPADFHEETVRKTTRLHQYDVMRANKAPMAWGLEVRFPYLDREFVDLVMSIDPVERMARPHLSPRHGVEKALLRLAFDTPGDPWIPDEALWRQKEQFSDGVGYDWVDALREQSVRRLRHGQLDEAPSRFPHDPPVNPEMYWMRELFEDQFVRDRATGLSPLGTVGTGRSIACSTPEAVSWDPEWEHFAGDISGRAIAGVHSADRDLLPG